MKLTGTVIDPHMSRVDLEGRVHVTITIALDEKATGTGMPHGTSLPIGGEKIEVVFREKDW